MSIAVPDRCILAKSNQLFEYSSPSNSQTEALKQKANALGLSVMQHKLVGHFWWEWPVEQKNVHFAGLAPPTSACWSSLDVHSLQTASMYTKKPKEMGSQLMICGLVYCLNELSRSGIYLTLCDCPYCMQIACHFRIQCLIPNTGHSICSCDALTLLTEGPPPTHPTPLFTHYFRQCNKSLMDPVRGAGSIQIQT